jgi:hypothetical protein
MDRLIIISHHVLNTRFKSAIYIFAGKSAPGGFILA